MRPESVTDMASDIKSNSTPNGVRPPQPAWVQVTPLFLSAVLFLSAIFSVFSALPLQVLSLQRRWNWLALAVVLNSIWVYALGGKEVFLLYIIYGLVPGVILGWLLSRGTSVSRSLAATVGAMLLTAAIILLAISAIHGVTPLEEIRLQMDTFLKSLESSFTPEAREQLLGGMDPADWSKAFLHELPSAIVLFALVQAWLSSVFLVRANPGGVLGKKGLRADLIRDWRIPDFWVWPTILCGFFMVFEVEKVTPWAANGFRVLMGLYALQGLVILGAFLDAWKIRGLIRSGIYLLVIFVMMPLLLSIGFFDQWFDFRKNLRQST